VSRRGAPTWARLAVASNGSVRPSPERLNEPCGEPSALCVDVSIPGIGRVFSCLLWAACGNDGSDGVVLEGNTACERFTSLALAKGCEPPATCAIEASCEAQAVEWVNCAATDLAQCSCESDGDLNCEGSFKPNEGPAQCVAEYEAFDVCEGP
jgi:hypothetical protein